MYRQSMKEEEHSAQREQKQGARTPEVGACLT